MELVDVRYGKEEVEAAAKRVTASDWIKADRVGTRSPPRITLFLTNQGDPDKVLDWKRSSLLLLLVDKNDHHAGAT